MGKPCAKGSEGIEGGRNLASGKELQGCALENEGIRRQEKAFQFEMDFSCCSILKNYAGAGTMVTPVACDHDFGELARSLQD